MRLLAAILAAAAVVQAGESAASKSLLQLVESSLGEVEVLTNNLTAQISMVDANNISTALPITTSNTNLISYITNATMKIKADDANITNSDSQALGAYTQALAYAVNHSIAELIYKKPAFSKLQLDSIVISNLQQQANSSNTLSAVILDKISEQLHPVAAAISDQISQSLQMGLECYQGMNSSCNPTPVNSSRTLDAAVGTGAINPSAGSTLQVAGWTVMLGAAAVAFATGL